MSDFLTNRLKYLGQPAGRHNIQTLEHDHFVNFPR